MYKKGLVLFLFPHRTQSCFGYLLKSPQISNKYPKHMFLEVLKRCFCIIADLLSRLDRRFRASQMR